MESEQSWKKLALTKVKPLRDQLGSNPNNIALKRRWWAYHAHRPELYSRLATLTRVLVIARVSRTFAFCFVNPKHIFSEQVVIVATDRWDHFTILQTRIHESWARFLSATMKDDLRYSASDCLVNFPLFSAAPTLVKLVGQVGEKYHEQRAAIMVKNNEGLTKTYNRFHNPDEHSPDIQILRDLHAQMDRAVLDAYGWTDIQPTYDFREQLDESTRLTWGEDTRDEVLARLLELNRVMAEAEAKQTATATEKKPAAEKKPKKAKKQDDGTMDLFGGKVK